MLAAVAYDTVPTKHKKIKRKNFEGDVFNFFNFTTNKKI